MSAKGTNSVSNSNPTYSDCHFSDVDLRSLIESVWATKIYTKNPKCNDKNNQFKPPPQIPKPNSKTKEKQKSQQDVEKEMVGQNIENLLDHINELEEQVKENHVDMRLLNTQCKDYYY